jgi:hypothetical protein
MSLAAETRDAVRERPFLFDALRAGVVNYTAAARELDVDGETEAVATALRRFAEELDATKRTEAQASVTMQSGVGLADGVDDAPEDAADDEAVLAAGGIGIVPDAGSLTAVVATGDVSATALETVLGRLRTAEVAVEAAGVADDTLVVAVERRDGANAVRVVEGALEAVPA